MSLQFQLLRQYIRLKASSEELKLLINESKKALDEQDSRVEILLNEYWNEIYSKWYAEYPSDRKFCIDRLYYSHYDFYQLNTNTSYTLTIGRDDIEIRVTYSDTKCRIQLAYDGTHKGCVRDGCHDFDEIINCPKTIQYILDFAKEVYQKFEQEKRRLMATRLD